MANRPKAKGTTFEVDTRDALTAAFGVEVVRQALHGNADEGDLIFFYKKKKIIIECKNYASYNGSELRRFLKETGAEKANARAVLGVLVCHRRGIGAARFGANDTFMRLDELFAPVGIVTDAAYTRLSFDCFCRLLKTVWAPLPT